MHRVIVVHQSCSLSHIVSTNHAPCLASPCYAQPPLLSSLISELPFNSTHPPPSFHLPSSTYQMHTRTHARTHSHTHTHIHTHTAPITNTLTPSLSVLPSVIHFLSPPLLTAHPLTPPHPTLPYSGPQPLFREFPESGSVMSAMFSSNWLTGDCEIPRDLGVSSLI